MNYLVGKRTYVLVALGVVYAVAGYLGGYVEGSQALQVLASVLPLAALRAALK